jgi:hypothetical protein
MTFKEEIQQTRVKNSSFCNPKFSANLRPIYLILFLPERACQDAEPDRALFLNAYFLSEKKG